MFTVHIDPIEVHGWQGWRFKSGPVSLVITPAIGGRIQSLRFEGKELLFVPHQASGVLFDFSQVNDVQEFKKQQGFRIFGGDKTWVSPQSAWTLGIPPIELDAGAYQIAWEEQTAVLTSPICRETGLQIVRKVRMDQDAKIYLEEQLHNKSDQPLTRGIWNVTQIRRPCEFFIPARKGAFRSYHEEDSTLPVVEQIYKEAHGWVEVFCHQPKLFKCGGMSSEGKVLIKMPLGGPKEIVWLKTFKQDDMATYAHRACVEVFNSDQDDYAEIELHAPLQTIVPGEHVSFAQEWQLKKL